MQLKVMGDFASMYASTYCEPRHTRKHAGVAGRDWRVCHRVTSGGMRGWYPGVPVI